VTSFERLDPTDQRNYESAYRRGMHHALVLAGDLADVAASLAGVRRLLRRAEGIAGEYRSQSRFPGRPPLTDEIRRRL
jgi:hypothetical protein